jgi:rare lipoprotein A
MANSRALQRSGTAPILNVKACIQLKRGLATISIALMSIFSLPLFAGKSAQSDATRSNSPKSVEVFAAWYRVPAKSLAHRRARGGEFTAANNSLPLGTLVRVTSLSNERSVIVRITDRGITNRRAKIDVCWEAAEKLGMIQQGLTRVRLEIIPEPVIATAPGSGLVPTH